mmetsp:Transcript_27648/g.61026  ORF Transcript_27648/g.61026 Transcript_27648/m.61026 type:complete len:151 (+) Transcript_27648:99-551(+)
MPATTYNKVPAHDQQQPEPEGQGQRNDDEDESHDHDEQLTTYTPQPLVGDPNQDLQLQPEKLTDSAAAGDLVLSVDDAIERLGMGRFQLIVLIVAGLCFSADAMQVLQLTFFKRNISFQMESDRRRDGTDTIYIIHWSDIWNSLTRAFGR